MQPQYLYTANDLLGALAIKSICARSPCSHCNTTLSPEQCAALTGRFIVVSVTQYREGPQFKLVSCTHCAYHHMRVIPVQSYLHWTKEGKWNNLGTPLDEDTARSFCKMLTGVPEVDSLVVVVL